MLHVRRVFMNSLEKGNRFAAFFERGINLAHLRLHTGYAGAASEALQRLSQGVAPEHYQALLGASAGEWDRFL